MTPFLLVPYTLSLQKMSPLLLFLLLLASPLQIHSKTSQNDIKALHLFHLSILPSSILPSSCLSSWSFTPSIDPCISSFSSHFTCGIRCITNNNISYISEISLDSAGYAGALSPSVWSFPFLQSLDLADNLFSGPIPSGPIPPSLRTLILSRNSFSGPIPDFTSSAAASVQEIYLDNNLLSDEITYQFSNLSSLHRLEIQGNILSGPLPDLSSSPSLNYLDASDNAFSGDLPETLPPSIIQISLRNNTLSGGLNVISATPSLQVLDVSNNEISGSVPGELFRHPSLEQLNLARNKFDAISEPGDGGESSRLVAVDLGYNKLKGYLPGFVGIMPRLSAVDFEGNMFTGMIPAQYAVRAVGMGGEEMVPFARMLLAGNYLFGPIPSPLETMEEGSAVSLGDNCLFRCPEIFFFCQGGEQKSVEECREFNPVIP